jgi:hypothetical protein
MSLDDGRKRGEGYPPEYWVHVRRARAWLVRSLLISGGAALFLGWGYTHDLLPEPFVCLAPLSALLFLFLLLFIPGTLDSIRVVGIRPYFNKSHPGVSGRLSFLSGEALARNCAYLDKLALGASLEPLSCFGFADDLGGGQVTWYEPERGLRSVSGLLTVLRQDPSLLREAEAVIAELVLVEVKLRDAVRHQAPFCLLLRYGSYVSPPEMDARQGYF